MDPTAPEKEPPLPWQGWFFPLGQAKPSYRAPPKRGGVVGRGYGYVYDPSTSPPSLSEMLA